jgi:hypothetical protein
MVMTVIYSSQYKWLCKCINKWVVESRMVQKFLINKWLQDLVFPAAEDKSVDFSVAMMLWRMYLPVRLNELVLWIKLEQVKIMVEAVQWMKSKFNTLKIWYVRTPAAHLKFFDNIPNQTTIPRIPTQEVPSVMSFKV